MSRRAAPKANNTAGEAEDIPVTMGAAGSVRYRLGLVVGKFAPLHRGHEWLVQQAAAQCDHLLILSYSNPEFARCEVPRRREWLAARFPTHESLAVDDAWISDACRQRGIAHQPMPHNSAEDAVQQHWLAWLLREVLGRTPDAMFCSEDYGPSCARTLSQAFGSPVAAVLVDRARLHVPIRATAIRAAPGLAVQWAAPEVARAFVRRVVLLGGESTGKTSLAAALAARLGTRWVSEYGRELWEQQGGLEEADLLTVAREQLAREDAAAGMATSWLVCDTSPLTTFGYAHWMFGRADPELARLAERRYDAIVLCQPDFAFIQDGTRRDADFRQTQHAWYLEQLRGGDTPWLAAEGPLAQRVAAVAAWLESA